MFPSSPVNTCLKLFINLDFNVLTYSNLCTAHCIAIRIHVEAREKPHIKVQGAHRWTLRKEDRHVSGPNFRNFNLS